MIIRHADSAGATSFIYGPPRWLSGKESACQCRRHGSDPWVGKIPSRRKWQPAPVFLTRKSHGQMSLEGYSPWGHKRIGHDLATKIITVTRRISLLSMTHSFCVLGHRLCWAVCCYAMFHFLPHEERVLNFDQCLFSIYGIRSKWFSSLGSLSRLSQMIYLMP